MALLTIDPGKGDIKKITGNVFGLAILGALGFAAYVYLLPFLITIVWGTAELIGGIVLVSLLALVVMQPKNWRAASYLAQAAAEFFLGWVITLNPFQILAFRLDNREEDAKDLLKTNKQAVGKQKELQEKLRVNDDEFQNAINQKEILLGKLHKNQNDIDVKERLDAVLSIIQTNKEYADNIKPLYNDFVKLAEFTNKAYRQAINQIAILRKDLEKKQDMYETVTTANTMVAKAWKALRGDENINTDADKAIAFLQKDISEKIGNIQVGIKIANDYMDGKDLENAAKLQTTVKQLENWNNSLNYSDTVDLGNHSQMALANNINSSANNYIDFLEIK